MNKNNFNKWKNFINESLISESSMGKVWILTHVETGDYNSSEQIVGVFSSEESAENRKQQLFDKMMAKRKKEFESFPNRSKSLLEPPENEWYDIEEYSVES